jgi:hypothetical protein
VVLTCGKVASLLRVTTRTAGKLCDRGLLKSHKLPGSAHRRVLLADLVTFMRGSGMPDEWIAEAESLATPDAAELEPPL